ncbi:hypothetical protein Micbo1qcDRAFT_164084 [Microdochium bolleyi]|uniref:Uncharacterized protein n=1 Tax=Microdochium bolleyi TaxID=196109 RepID=A0A136IZU5_9PEZI|nr:hypothetical protein Micbo1qcDRAFT_164084 [Microdochium bolleyi]
MLIDAEVGPKDSDWTAIELMANAGLRTAIVLTKADKVKNGQEGLSKTCKTVWEGIRRIEAQLAESNKKWTWEKEFYVTATGATDAAVRRATITTARLVVARLAGLIKDTRPEAATNQKWSGKIVSFDELFGHSSADPAETSAAEPELQQDDIQVKQDEWDEVEDVEDEGVNVEKESEANAALESRMHNHRHREPTPPRRSSNNTARESPRWKVTGSRTTRPGPMSRHGGSKKPASKAKGRSTPTHAPKVVPTDPLSRMQAASRPVLGSRTQRPPKASFFHTTSCSWHAQSAPPAPSNQSQTPPQPHPLKKEELGAVLSDFITTLQPSTTLRDLVRQRKLDMETGVGQPTPEELSQSWADRLEANKQALARRHWRGTRRIREVRDRRLAHEEDKLRRQEAMLAEQARLEKDTDWVAIRREMRAMEREKKAEEARLLAALEESQRGLEEYADEHGEKPAEEEYGEGEGADEEIDLSARAGARRGRRGGKVDEFERVFASKLGGSGGGGGKSDKGGKSKSARPSF